MKLSPRKDGRFAVLAAVLLVVLGVLFALFLLPTFLIHQESRVISAKRDLVYKYVNGFFVGGYYHFGQWSPWPSFTDHPGVWVKESGEGATMEWLRKSPRQLTHVTIRESIRGRLVRKSVQVSDGVLLTTYYRLEQTENGTKVTLSVEVPPDGTVSERWRRLRFVRENAHLFEQSLRDLKRIIEAGPEAAGLIYIKNMPDDSGL